MPSRASVRLALLAALATAALADNIWQERTELLESFNAYEPPPNMHGPKGDHEHDAGPLQIKVGMAIRKIDFNIISGDLRLTFWLRLKWYDERLAFDASKFPSIDAAKGFLPIALRSGDDRNIWVPDVLIINATTDSNDELGEEIAMVYPRQSPKLAESPPWNVFWARMGTVNIHCSPDMKLYPFDRPVCPLLLESWGFTADYVVLVNDSDGWQSANAHPSSNEYKFLPGSGIKTAEELTEWTAIGTNWSSFHTTLYFQRYPAYAILHTVVPTGLVTLLSTLTFYLPLNEDMSGSGERVGYAATLLLTVIAIILFTAEQRPAVRVATWLDQWCSKCLVLTTAPLMQTIFGMYFRGLIQGRAEQQIQKDAHIEKMLPHENKEDDAYLKWAQHTHYSRGRCMRKFLGPPLPRVMDTWCRHMYPFFVLILLAPLVAPIFKDDQGSGMVVAQRLFTPLCVWLLVQCCVGLGWLFFRINRSVQHHKTKERFPDGWEGQSSPTYAPMDGGRSERSRGVLEVMEVTDSDSS